MSSPRSPHWTDVKRKLNSWGRPEFLGLVKELFEQSAETRSYLAARLLQDSLGEVVLRPYRQRMIDAFYTKVGWPRSKLGLADARKAIRDYRRATSDISGTLELMLTYIETGTQFTLEFGDMEETFYNSLCSVLAETARILDSDQAVNLYGQFRQRLLDLARRAGDLGWGYGDEVVDTISALEERHSA
jgi:hypothetical protein